MSLSKDDDADSENVMWKHDIAFLQPFVDWLVKKKLITVSIELKLYKLFLRGPHNGKPTQYMPWIGWVRLCHGKDENSLLQSVYPVLLIHLRMDDVLVLVDVVAARYP